MKKLWLSLREMWTIYRTYKVWNVSIKEQWRLLKLYKNKENNA